MDFIIGVIIGATLAPFWVAVYNKFVKQYVDNFFKKD
ncbi:MAG: hypothetical protein DDT31_00022 [Syntrophomonadaceae bacterium]|nr:hypothetical protein [Bacillota bacterium]